MNRRAPLRINPSTLMSPKFKKLMALTGEGKWLTIGLLQGIWSVAQANCPRGDIGRMPNDDIAVDLGIPLDEIDGLIAALVEAGWLEEHPEDRLVVCGWTDAPDGPMRAGKSRLSPKP